MTQGIKRPRWQDNPQHRVGQAQLKRIAEAAKTAKVQADSGNHKIARQSHPAATARP